MLAVVDLTEQDIKRAITIRSIIYLEDIVNIKVIELREILEVKTQYLK